MKRVLSFIFVLVILFGCAGREVTRVSSDKQTDYSGRWNDTDSKLVAREMIGQLLSSAWVDDFRQSQGEKPVVIVGSVRLKEASEHINTSAFIKDIEREMINSGKVRFVANSAERGELRQERIEQQTNASVETAKRLAAETGADFMLIGNIVTFIDEYDKQKAKFYQVDLEMINVESNEKIWIGSKEIKKLIGKKSSKW